jgi:multimeric flavodoxin WrbA
MATRIAVVFYASTGHVHQLAEAVAAGAESTGAEVRLGTPTRFGNPTAQIKQFIDQAGPLWAKGLLADKAAVGQVDDAALTAARIQGERLATFAGRVWTRRAEDDVPADQAEAYGSRP